jgi:hypothetical protein
MKLNNSLTQLQCLLECYVSVVLQLVSISSPYWPYLLHSSYQTQTLDVLQIKWKISLLLMKIISLNIIWKSDKGFHKQIWYVFIYIYVQHDFHVRRCSSRVTLNLMDVTSGSLTMNNCVNNSTTAIVTTVENDWQWMTVSTIQRQPFLLQ